MNDITEVFKDLIIEHRDIDIADSEFRHLCDDTPELQESYAEWCDENGYNLKNGFKNFCHDFLESQDSIWQSLNDYDEY